jgi:hypothetical protein
MESSTIVARVLVFIRVFLWLGAQAHYTPSREPSKLPAPTETTVARQTGHAGGHAAGYGACRSSLALSRPQSVMSSSWYSNQTV